MSEKEKCKKLKEIRKKLSEELGINLNQRDCTYKGECSGTCPKCQEEEKILNNHLLKKTVITSTIATLGLGIIGCGSSLKQPLSGDVQMVEEVEINEISNKKSENLETTRLIAEKNDLKKENKE